MSKDDIKNEPGNAPDIKTLLLYAQSGSCTCRTKTPEVKYHNGDCRYRVLVEAESHIAALEAQLAAQGELRQFGLSRAEFHDKAWALYHAKTFDDTQLAKVNIHTIRSVFDACYDAAPPAPSSIAAQQDESERDKERRPNPANGAPKPKNYNPVA